MKMGIKDNIWWTRKSQIQMEKRLLSNAFQSELLLFWYSFFSVSVAIYLLGNEQTSSADINILWVIFSVLVLTVSGFINGLSFKERASLVKETYETLSRIYQECNENNEDGINREYQQILNVCENHKDKDYYKALCIEHLNSTKQADKDTGIKKNLDRKPSTYQWCYVAGVKLTRYLTLIFLYGLPAIILWYQYLR